LNSNLEFEFKRISTTRVPTQSEKGMAMYMNQSKHGAYFNKNNTSICELILELKNKSKTQVKQCKNYPKNYHKLLVFIGVHGKKMTPRN